ncbi:MAG: hypothetical protein J6Y82_05830 [Bacteroidales bacterium]|nr:hypothetical protein [Bacteroidales bacterium]
MKANFLKVILMAIAICTAASNITLAQGRHGGGHQNGAKIENKGQHNGPKAQPKARDGHHAQPKAHGGHHAKPKAHGGPHFNNGHHGHGPHFGGHAYRAPRHHRFGHRHHNYFVVRHPRPLPSHVRYRSFSVAPAVGTILTELPLHAVEVLIDDITYYSAMGLLFRPFYVDNVMHFEVMNPF